MGEGLDAGLFVHAAYQDDGVLGSLLDEVDAFQAWLHVFFSLSLVSTARAISSKSQHSSDGSQA